MNQGRIEQIDTPQALYARPANEFVARFLGFHNLIPAQVHPESPEVASTSIGAFSLAAILAKPLQPGPHTLLIRPEAARLDSTYSQPGWLLRGVLAACSFRGSHCRIVVTIHSPTDSQQLRFHLPAYQGQQLPAVGETIELALEPAMMTLL
jgi:ABC-type Fe3+/spermidine/putrescine transport system ATPase subunit